MAAESEVQPQPDSGHAVAAVVITVSDRSARGERVDESGPCAVELLRATGYLVKEALIVPDGVDSVRNAVLAAVLSPARLVITTGGTGVGPSDLTPEGTRPLLTRELPGIAEALRREGAISNKHAVLSRGVVGVVDGEDAALVVNLPGSVASVEDGLRLVLPLIPHILDQLDGRDHHQAADHHQGDDHRGNRHSGDRDKDRGRS